MKTKLRILFIHKEPCARAYKEAVALHKLGHTIDLACEKNDQHPNILNYLDDVYFYKNYEQLASIVRQGKWDVIHSHNEPNMPTVVAIRNAGHCPVVYDCHDVTGLRQKLEGERRENERVCFEESDGIIMVTETLVEIARDRFQVDNILALPCYCLVDEMARIQRSKLEGNHIVYQGMLLDGGVPPLEYRNYYPFFKKMVECDMHVHVYCSAFNPRVQSSYIDLQQSSDLFHFHQQVPYAQLLDEMSQYTWGLVAFNVEEIHEQDRLTFLNSILPNKLFDYVFSGVCPVVFNNKTAGEWVEKHGVGYYARSEAEMLDILTSREPLPYVENVMFMSMEENIKNLEDLYCIAINKKDATHSVQ